MRLASSFVVLMLVFPLALSAQEGEAAVADPALDRPAAEVPAEAAPEAAAEAGGQAGDQPGAAAVSDPAGEEPRSSTEVRSDFGALLRQHAPEVRRVLALDPALLTNEQYMARYPELAAFVSAHPEVRRNPHFYLPPVPVERESGFLSELLEMMIISATFLLIALALAWLVRTLIEQKRWSRLSRTQSEVHNKILDRFGTSEELLAYIKSPAGSRFLESAPIPLHVESPAPQSAPLTRVLWSVQIGVVVGAAALGMLLVSLRFGGETGQGLFALGAIGVCMGAGFVAAAVVSMVLSHRLGLWQPRHDSAPPVADRIDDTGFVG